MNTINDFNSLNVKQELIKTDDSYETVGCFDSFTLQNEIKIKVQENHEKQFPEYYNLNYSYKNSKQLHTKCPICSKVFQKRLKRNKHFNLHFKKHPVICRTCGKLFPVKQDFVYHYTFHLVKQKFKRKLKCSDQNKILQGNKIQQSKPHAKILTKKGKITYNCKNCTKKFSHKKYLLDHHCSTIKINHKCSICAKIFPRKGNLNSHMLSHTGECQFQCPICFKSYCRKQGLEYHMATHSSEKQFQCKVCLKSFNRKDTLLHHEKIHKKNRWECKLCLKKFQSNKHYQEHMYIHNGDTYFSCKVCLRKFTTEENLKKHEKIHLGETPYQCPHCPKSFTLKSGLSSHEKVHATNRNFPCNQCSLIFPIKSKLSMHIWDIHEGPYECEQCLKTFTTRSGLRKHKVLHSDRKITFPCSICSKTFTWKNSLRSHEKQHANGNHRPFVCPVCSKGFTQKGNYNVHLKIHEKQAKVDKEEFVQVKYEETETTLNMDVKEEKFLIKIEN